MASLKEKSIAAYRAVLLTATSPKFCSLWSEADTSVEGGDEDNVSYKEMVLRDILAYVICRFMWMRDFAIFGGFIRSHYSGKPWNDIDIMMFSSVDKDRLMKHVIDFVHVTLGLSKLSMSYTYHSRNNYGKSVDFKVRNVLDDGKDIVVKFDLVQAATLETIMNRLPVTIGSCLQMYDTGGAHIRQNDPIINRRLSRWNASEIIELLQVGQDVKLCLKAPLTGSAKLTYQRYYWCKIIKMLSCGWEFVIVDGHEPDVMSVIK